MEAIYQACLQIILLLLSQTKTPTISGFESFFQKDSFIGLPVNASEFITISLTLSLLSTVLKSIKMVKLEKGFYRFKPKLTVGIWAGFAVLRKVASIVAFFTPSLGLFSLLAHWQYENTPFRVRLEQASTNNSLDYLQNVKINLYNMTEEVAWSSLDRWSYEDPRQPRPPPASIYTFLSPQNSFLVYFGLFIVQILALLLVKILFSDDFRERKDYFKKMIHLIQVCNMPMPFKDWDVGKIKCIQTFKDRYKKTEKEMLASFATTFIFTLISMVPLCVTGE